MVVAHLLLDTCSFLFFVGCFIVVLKSPGTSQECFKNLTLKDTAFREIV